MRIEEIRAALNPKRPPIVSYLDPDGEERSAWVVGVSYGRVTIQTGIGRIIEGIHPDSISHFVRR